jgi:uncharacterized protein (TIGR03067 family)
MKTLSLFVAVGFVVGAATGVAAPRGDEKPAKDDIKKLEGDWKVTTWQQASQELPGEALETVKWSVKGDKYKFEMAGQMEEGTIKVDPAKKPATIDLEITSGNDQGKSQVGIYKIDGQVITFCFARPGVKDRPTEFTSTEDNGHILLSVRRAKKDD